MQKTSLARYWLLIGVAALAIAGLYSLVLAGGRSPSLGESALLARLFHKTLVVHVDLSVLVWFLAMACLLWSRLTQNFRSFIPYMEESALICFVLGTAAITFSPFDPNGEALMSNYIPVIHSPVFFFGLMLIFCGTLLMAVKVLTFSHWRQQRSLGFALYSAALITVIAFAALVWSYMQMPAVIDGQQYYDLLFWGGGHILQFTHTQMLIVAWLMLTLFLSPEWQINHKAFHGIFWIGLVATLVTPLPYVLFEITDAGHRSYFTQLMIVAGGLAPMLALWCIVPALWSCSRRNGCIAALIMSIALFFYGGVLGLMIEGQNVVIPAHYHGSIVGITLAFMGVVYLLLPGFGYRDVSGSRLAWVQPYIYGLGQIMHVTGFAWSGGYGALRKTPGGAYEGTAKIAMGLMGGGAGLAAIGGLLFVVVVVRAVLKKN